MDAVIYNRGKGKRRQGLSHNAQYISGSFDTAEDRQESDGAASTPHSGSVTPVLSQGNAETSGSFAKRQKLNLEAQVSRRELGQKIRDRELRKLAAHDRNTIEAAASFDPIDVDPDNWIEVPIGEAMPNADGEEPEVVDAYDIEHAGETLEVIVDSLRGIHYISKRVGVTHTRRTHAERLARETAAWSDQYDILADEYLRWKSTPEAHVTTPTKPPNPDAAHFLVDALGWSYRNYHHPIYYNAASPGEPLNQTIIRTGFLSSSPLLPRRVFSLQALEMYYYISRRFSRLGIQPFVKALCDSQRQTYRPNLRLQFSAAFDVYLEILRRVDARVAVALHRNTADWRMLHSCPPCQHRGVAGEGELEFSMLFSLDGNVSLKRFGDAGKFDARHLNSDYFIPRADVDLFAKSGAKPKRKRKAKAKGKGKAKGQQKISDLPNDSGSDGDGDGDVEMQPCSTDPEKATEEDAEWVTKNVDIAGGSETIPGVVSVCVERWKANADDTKKGMFACFDESGIFAAAYRHGMILCVTDMVASGELAKYPLAVLNKVEDTIPGKKAGGYDIGCAFEDTAENNPTLGPKLCTCLVTPAMHGYAHIRPCQVHFHPIYYFGTGLEDFEMCERVFSSSNDCARVTRYATRFHRHQRIDQHFQQWDNDKYEALGTFIYNNYKQALTIIEEHTDIFNQLKVQQPDLGPDDFKSWLREEATYLEGLETEPEEDTLAIDYVEALEKFRDAEAAFELSRQNLSKPTPQAANGDLGKRRSKPSHKAAIQDVNLWQTVVHDLEIQLDVAERWTPESEEYRKTKSYIYERKWRLTLDALEKAMVSRLFELQKSHLESTGYKLRQQIAKHLQTRNARIRTLLAAHNTAARAVGRPTISFSELVQYSFLSEFDLLRGARQDIRSKPWAKPANRVLMDKYFRLEHAKEEIRRLNIEILRLEKWMGEEERTYSEVLKGFEDADSPLAVEVKARGEYRRRVHLGISATLQKARVLRGYNGPPSSSRQPSTSITASVGGGSSVVNDDAGDDDEDDEDDGDDDDDETHAGVYRVEGALQAMEA